MEDLVEDGEYEELYDSSVEESGKSSLSWLWSKGLWLGKKVVITGVMFSAAPFFLPPLVVFSAIGLAASVPAGVVLASYTCTEKLMSKWLPLTPPLSSTRLEVEDDSAEYFYVSEKEQGGVPVWSGVDSIQDIEDGGEYNEVENKGSPEMSYAKIENVAEENENKPPDKETDLPLEVKEVLAVVQDDTKNMDDPKKQRETVLVSNASEVDFKKAGEVTGNKEAKMSEEGTASLLNKRHDDLSSHEPPKKKKKKSKAWLKLSHIGRAEHRTVESKKETGKPIEFGHDKPKLAEDNAVEIDHKAEKGEVAAAEVENLAPTAPISRLMPVSKDKENGNITEARTDPMASRAELRSAVVEDPVTKTQPVEKTLWEQIDALRVIVGYQAARKPVWTDELRALYVFTGVEPPSSFEKSTDIRGTEDKLHFLMSIVGVK